MNQSQAKKVFDIIQEQKAKRRAAGNGYQGPSNAQRVESVPGGPHADFEQLVREAQITWKIGKVDAMKRVMRENPDAHRRYLEAANPGVKID